MQMFTSLTEEWRPVADFPDYEVSNYGRVRSLDRYRRYAGGRMRLIKGQLLKPLTNKYRGKYLHVTLSDKCRQSHRAIHRLVAEAFIPNPDRKEQINHIDCDPTNNRVENLEWVTPKENVEWMIVCGRQRITTEKPVVAINPETNETLYFKSTKEAERCGHTRSAIWRAITGEYKTHHGLIWKNATEV